MSDQAQILHLARRTALVATWERAYEALARFCRGQGRMSIPVQPADDDLIIMAMLKRGEWVETQLQKATDKE